MRISSAVPSDYLKAADLQGRNITVTISHVEMKDIGGDHRPVLYFAGEGRGMVLNKTNSNTIAAAYGDDTDDWQSAELILFEAMVDFQGKTVPAIRCKIPPRKPVQAAQSNGNDRPRGNAIVTSGAPERASIDDLQTCRFELSFWE